MYVMDVTGLEYNRKLYDLVTGAMRALAEFMADHYVEMIKVFTNFDHPLYKKSFQYFVPVNLPTFATALYIAVRPLLPKRTEQKVLYYKRFQLVTGSRTFCFELEGGNVPICSI